jgi:hypothetical protein
LLVSLLSVVLASAVLIGIAVEGLICVVMAAPLGVVMAVIGGVTGYIIQRAPREVRITQSVYSFSLIFFVLPGMIFTESLSNPEPSLRKVSTRIEIRAAPEEVWPQLVAFTEIPAPTDWLFQTGIAYPIRAEMHGEGVGAIRKCVFTTGAFIEPIEVWDEPSLLKFSVIEQPAVMDEVSPYDQLRPPHLNHYLHSRQGQFLLTRLDNGSTLLEGSTWYQNSFWPGTYWNLWSDHIIHRIHLRVLEHIKTKAEIG